MSQSPDLCQPRQGGVGGEAVTLRGLGREPRASHRSRSFVCYICHHSSHRCTIPHSPHLRGCWVPLFSRSCEPHESSEPPTPPRAHPQAPLWRSWSLGFGGKLPSTSQRVVRSLEAGFWKCGLGLEFTSISISSGKVKMQILGPLPRLIGSEVPTTTTPTPRMNPGLCIFTKRLR